MAYVADLLGKLRNKPRINPLKFNVFKDLFCMSDKLELAISITPTAIFLFLWSFLVRLVPFCQLKCAIKPINTVFSYIPIMTMVKNVVKFSFIIYEVQSIFYDESPPIHLTELCCIVTLNEKHFKTF